MSKILKHAASPKISCWSLACSVRSLPKLKALKVEGKNLFSRLHIDDFLVEEHCCLHKYLTNHNQLWRHGVRSAWVIPEDLHGAPPYPSISFLVLLSHCFSSLVFAFSYESARWSGECTLPPPAVGSGGAPPLKDFYYILPRQISVLE